MASEQHIHHQRKVPTQMHSVYSTTDTHLHAHAHTNMYIHIWHTIPLNKHYHNLSFKTHLYSHILTTVMDRHASMSEREVVNLVLVGPLSRDSTMVESVCFPVKN